MERDDRSRFELDYSWVDNIVTDVVSYYQTATQLKDISWGVPGYWYLEGPKGPKSVCS